MEQRLTIVTLGVEDLARSTAFYERLGWQRAVKEAEGIAFFQLGGSALGLYPLEALAADAKLPKGEKGQASFTLAQNQRNKAEVDAVLAEAVAAGATLVKPAEQVFWGGYCGYFADPDGHLWEIAWNPGFPLDETGAVTLPA